MSLRRARTADEYIEWVKQAVFEVDDLHACMEFDMEDIGQFPPFLEPLVEGVKGLYQSMCDGSYRFGREDLPFMDLVQRYGDEIPFHTLLKQINETHRKGLDAEGGD
ncbi:MAG TPA: general secretion pathway protein GspF [Chromatiales bacterium]|nr:general secretion pathway protein GspF [Chromatiales bacterium]